MMNRYEHSIVCDGEIANSGDLGKYCKKCGLILQKVTPKSMHGKKCRICRSNNQLSEHHIIPKRTGLKTKKVILCKLCHRIADLLASVLYPDKLKVD